MDVLGWNSTVYNRYGASVANSALIYFFCLTNALSFSDIIICVPGSEAMYADLGHFSQLSIKVHSTIMLMMFTCTVLLYCAEMKLYFPCAEM